MTLKPDKLYPQERFAAALREIGPTMGKTAENPFFKSRYIPLPELLEYVVPILNKHGLYINFPNDVSHVPGQVYIVAAVCDEATGEELDRSCVVQPLMDNPQKNTQNYTYGRRTATTCLLGIAEKDDDGNSVAGNIPEATDTGSFEL